MSAGLPSFFKTPKNRSFDYKPVYYSEEKERKKELDKLIEESKSGEVSDERRLKLLRGKLNHRWSSGSRSSLKGQSTSQMIRFVAIGALLCGLVWLFFNWG